MALRSTIYKIDLSIADMDRNHYADYPLTIARHPSETEERMMLRLLAFALHADPQLSFAGGLSTVDEPDLWQRDLTGVIRHWIEVGLPEEKLVRRACGRADKVSLIAYGGSRARLWWKAQGEALSRCRNLEVVQIEPSQSEALAALAARNLKLSCTIQERAVWIGNDAAGVTLELETLLAGAIG